MCAGKIWKTIILWRNVSASGDGPLKGSKLVKCLLETSPIPAKACVWDSEKKEKSDTATDLVNDNTQL